MTTPDTPEQVGWPLNTGVTADAARAATASRPSPSVSGIAGIANAEVVRLTLEQRAEMEAATLAVHAEFEALAEKGTGDD